MALIRKVGFTRFSRWGENLGRLSATAAKHTEGLDGTDEIEITCADDVSKGDYIVWFDHRGDAHEHIVDEPTRTHAEDGTTETQFKAVNSIAELWDDWNDDLRPSDASVALALSRVLDGTRWSVGTCDQEGTASHTFYHQSARESIADIADVWGGEVETTITTDGNAVISRAVGIRAQRGNQSSPKRFTWTKDIKSISRTVASDNPKTRVYGYGKGVETDTGGYGRRLTFEEINGGLAYVEDTDATAVWGHLGADGDVLPACTSYVNEECEDASQLLEETQAYLEEVSQPQVSYTADVLDLYAFGRDWEDVAVGDKVAIIDKGFSDEGVRLSGRVSQIERDLFSGDATVTFGNLSDAMADMWQSVSQSLKSSSLRSAVYDAVAATSANWLVQLQNSLNEQFSAAGTYKVETFELGTIYSNVQLDSTTGLPVKSISGMWAVNISGRGIRLASGLTSSGEWEWSTFITGEGATADLINAGTLNADLIRTGTLEVTDGEDTLLYVDFDSGIVELSAYSTTEEVNAAITAKADEISLAVEGAKVHYCKCDTTALKQIKVCTDASFVKYVGATVCVKFTYANEHSSPELCVQNASSDATETATGFIHVNGETMTSDAYWSAGDVITFVWDGTYWEEMDGYTRSAVDVLRNSITLSVTKGSGISASITLSVDGEEQSVSARSAFAAESSFITISAGRVTFNSGTFVVNSTYFKVDANGAITATSGKIAGFNITTSAIYKNKDSLTSNTSGVYVGLDGISVGGDTQYVAMYNGYIYGGNSTDYTGYMGFNNYNTATGIYGARLAGKGCIALLTDGFLGVAGYYDTGTTVTCSTGQTETIPVITKLSASWSNLSLTGTYNVSNICQNLSISWTNGSIGFTKGLMTTYGY